MPLFCCNNGCFPIMPVKCADDEKCKLHKCAGDEKMLKFEKAGDKIHSTTEKRYNEKEKVYEQNQ